MDKRIINKRRKKKTPTGLYISVTALVIIIIAAALIIIGNNRENAKIAATGTRIYFFDPQANSLKPEYRPIAASENTEKVKFVLEELSVGPKSAALQVSVGREIIKSAVISGNNVDVSVNGSYYGLKNDEEIICRSAIVHTLTDLPFVETVTINVDGNELLKPNGQPIGKMKSQDIVMVPDINLQGETPRTIKLYFADASGTGLVAESRTISTNPNESLAKYIVNEIIKGPASDELLPTVPSDTKLLEIDVLDGVCNVDLSKEFITKHTGAPGTERLAVYSIVNSLCEQSDIKNVQFLIESKRQEQFKDETGFNNLYEAKEMPPDA